MQVLRSRVIHFSQKHELWPPKIIKMLTKMKMIMMKKYKKIKITQNRSKSIKKSKELNRKRIFAPRSPNDPRWPGNPGGGGYICQRVYGQRGAVIKDTGKRQCVWLQRESLRVRVLLRVRLRLLLRVRVRLRVLLRVRLRIRVLLLMLLLVLLLSWHYLVVYVVKTEIASANQIDIISTNQNRAT